MLSPVLAARNMGEASLLPPLTSSTHNFLEQCAAKLPVECGVEIVGTLFGDGTLTASCCSNLVAIGRPCHDEFLAVTLPFHKEVDPSIVLAKSEKFLVSIIFYYSELFYSFFFNFFLLSLNITTIIGSCHCGRLKLIVLLHRL
ncbi:hypothetical protein ACOSQ2_004652 [Xanthoceras sorbifolium]